MGKVVNQDRELSWQPGKTGSREPGKVELCQMLLRDKVRQRMTTGFWIWPREPIGDPDKNRAVE